MIENKSFQFTLPEFPTVCVSYKSRFARVPFKGIDVFGLLFKRKTMLVGVKHDKSVEKAFTAQSLFDKSAALARFAVLNRFERVSEYPFDAFKHFNRPVHRLHQRHVNRGGIRGVFFKKCVMLFKNAQIFAHIGRGGAVIGVDKLFGKFLLV